MRTWCTYCETVRKLIKLPLEVNHGDEYECETCGLVQWIDTQPEDIT